MMILRRALLSLAIFGIVPPLSAGTGPQDEAEIRAVAVRQGETWNRHDAAGYAALFTEDCDVVNVVGWWWKGRAEVERKLTAAFAYVFRDSQLTITDVEVRFLSPDVALAHARWTMTGARTPPGVPEPRAGIQTLTFSRQGEHWRIAGFQNTTSLPEQPFPPGPPTSSAPPPETRRVPQLENAHVKVWKSLVVPNQPLPAHRHDHGRVIVALQGGTMKIAEVSGASETEVWETGKAYWLPANPPGVMHTDVNVGDKPIEVMVIEVQGDNPVSQ